MKKPFCAYCGSDNVVRDAWAEWDIENQEWELQDVYDDAYCFECDDSTSLEWIEINKESLFN